MKKSTTTIATLALMLSLLTSALKSYGQDSHVSLLINNVNSRLNYGGTNSSLQGHKKDVRGLQAGLSWQAGVTKNFSIVTEAYFVKKGGALKSDNPVDGMKSSLKLYTVEVPVLARIHAGKFYFNAGPYANYMLSGKKFSDSEGNQSISFGSGAGGFKKWEAGVQGGAGYQFSLKKTRMALDVRYTHGLTSIASDRDLFNRTINISVLVHRSWKRQG
jgi:hypothetical protein